MSQQLSPEQIQRYHDVIEEVGPEFLREKLAQMQLIRAFEQQIDHLHQTGRTHGTLHLSIGQEATSAAAISAVREVGYLLSHHRGHGHFLSWSDDPNRVLAEILGKETGFCRGRGGTMHVADVANGNLGGNGIVGGGLPMAVGVGLSIELRATDQVCLVIFGDGAVNEGAFHESLNMASIWDLPVIYLCENNLYAMSTPISYSFNVDFISERGAAYGIPGVTVDGNDFLAVYIAVRDAMQRAQHGDGPTLIESRTYRIKGHSRSDRQVYRTRDEVRSWADRDPILRFGELLVEAGVISPEEIVAMESEANARVEAAVEFAESSPDPDPDTLLDDVYA